jgi:hypothetical protein
MTDGLLIEWLTESVKKARFFDHNWPFLQILDRNRRSEEVLVIEF